MNNNRRKGTLATARRTNMAITYYPSERAKMKMHVVEQQQQPNVLYSMFGTQNLNKGSLSVGVWCPKGWEVRRVSLNFDVATAKDYTMSLVRGIGISAGKNDRLWVKADPVAAQEVIVPQGFYTGTTLATALATALNAKDFPIASKPFTVSYDAMDGKFTIAPAAGTAKLFTSNLPAVHIRWISTLAPLIGFTADTAMAASFTSDSAVEGLGTKMVYLSASRSSLLDVLSSDIVAMTIDNQLLIEANYAAAGAAESSSSSSASLDADLGVAAYEVVYKILDA